MKNKLLLTISFLSLFGLSGYSQIDITPWGGYNFGARVGIYGGELKVSGNGTYGINLEYAVDDETGIRFSYSYTESKIRINDYYYPGGGISNGDFSNVTENYFLLGGVRYLGNDQVQPYGAFSLGAAYYTFNHIDPYYQALNQTDMLRFAIDFGLGLKIMVSPRVGIDLHVRALAPMQWGGIGIGIGTGGASAGAYVGSTFISGDVGGGLVFRLSE